MNKLQFLSLIKNLIETIKETYSDDLLEQIKELFNQYLKNNPFDPEIWIKYSLFLYRIAYDEISTIECLQKGLRYDPENIIIKIMLAYGINHAIYANKDVLEIASSIKTTNPEYLSIQEYEKSWYYYLNNKKMYKKSLLKSIDYCDIFVWNYKHLGLLYLYEEKDIKKARYCFQKALNNIKLVYPMGQHQYDVLDIEEFFNERLKGIHATQPNIESIQELLESCR